MVSGTFCGSRPHLQQYAGYFVPFHPSRNPSTPESPNRETIFSQRLTPFRARLSRGLDNPWSWGRWQSRDRLPNLVSVLKQHPTPRSHALGGYVLTVAVCSTEPERQTMNSCLDFVVKDVGHPGKVRILVGIICILECIHFVRNCRGFVVSHALASLI